MRQPDIDGLFSKVHPKKCGDLHLMNPTNFPVPIRMRMVGGDFHFIKKRGKFCIIQIFFLTLQQHRPA